MALSLEALHKPLNRFFLDLLATGPESSVSFFFDKFGSQFSDGDFFDTSTEPPVYNRNLALERWSETVNRVPEEDADGVSVKLTSNSIDTTYGLRMLKPSLPHLADAADEQSRDQIVGQFSVLKDFAVKRWDQISLESSTGLMLSFIPSPPSPADWYDRENQSIWTSHSFQVQGDASPTAPSTPATKLWRLKVDDAVLQKALSEQTPAPPPARTLLSKLVAAKKFNLAAHGAGPTTSVGHFSVLAAGNAAGGAKYQSTGRFALHDGFRKNIAALSIRDRLEANQLLLQQAPTKPVTTPGISVSFEYCVIRVTRPWLNDAFLNDRSWYVPGMAKGELTSPGTAGALPLLPIAAVAVRKLRITANWTQEDIAAAAEATNFGPFRVSGGIANGALAREGIQVIGWLMQRLPTLPPNDPDSP